MIDRYKTVLGAVTGYVINVITGNLGYAILVAFITGFAALAGQYLFKYTVHEIKKYLDGRKTKK